MQDSAQHTFDRFSVLPVKTPFSCIDNVGNAIPELFSCIDKIGNVTPELFFYIDDIRNRTPELFSRIDNFGNAISEFFSCIDKVGNMIPELFCRIDKVRNMGTEQVNWGFWEKRLDISGKIESNKQPEACLMKRSGFCFGCGKLVIFGEDEYKTMNCL